MSTIFNPRQGALLFLLVWAGLPGAAELRDPMRPPVQARPAPPVDAASAAQNARAREADRLVAIRQDSSQRWQALFGDRWLVVGDRLDKFSVASIEVNAVQLTDGRTRRVLTLLPSLKVVDTAIEGSAEVAQARVEARPNHRPTARPTP